MGRCECLPASCAVHDEPSADQHQGRKAFDELIAAAENGRDFETSLYDIALLRGGTNETGLSVRLKWWV
jgi:hypothetical protein